MGARGNEGWGILSWDIRNVEGGLVFEGFPVIVRASIRVEEEREG